MEKLRFSRMKRRNSNEKCPPSVRLAHLCEEHRKNNDKYQASPGSFYRRGLARSSSASQDTFDFRDRRRYADLGCECRNFYGGPVHGGRAGCTANPSMSGAECAVLQRLDPACRAKE